MSEMPTSQFGLKWAADYDALHPIPEAATRATVERVAALAAGGCVLEVGVGTGRLALPLAALGLEVHGTDNSADMLAKMAEKDLDGTVRTWVAEMADMPGDGSYAVVLAAFNCLNNLRTLDDQLAVFTAAAATLAPGGVLITETPFFDPRAFVPARPFAITPDGFVARFGDYDHLTQVMEQAVLIYQETLDVRPDRGRMIHPAEIDLMGRVAGLTLESRDRDWVGTPVAGSAGLGTVVCVLRKPA